MLLVVKDTLIEMPELPVYCNYMIIICIFVYYWPMCFIG